MTSTMSSRFTASFIVTAWPLAPMYVTLGPMARSTGSMRSNAASSPPIMSDALPCCTVTGLPESGASSIARPRLRELGRDGPRDVGRDRAHVDIDGAGPDALEHAVLAERDGLHGRAVGHDRERDVGGRRDGGRRVGRLHALLDEGRRALARAIPARNRVTGCDQARHDDLAHGAEADKSDVHPTPSVAAAQRQ